MKISFGRSTEQEALVPPRVFCIHRGLAHSLCREGRPAVLSTAGLYSLLTWKGTQLQVHAYLAAVRLSLFAKYLLKASVSYHMDLSTGSQVSSQHASGTLQTELSERDWFLFT